MYSLAPAAEKGTTDGPTSIGCSDNGTIPYFEERVGPWVGYFRVDCVVVADINDDGLDDLVLCVSKNDAKIYVQKRNGEFKQLALPSVDSVRGWNNVRVRGAVPILWWWVRA